VCRYAYIAAFVRRQRAASAARLCPASRHLRTRFANSVSVVSRDCKSQKSEPHTSACDRTSRRVALTYGSAAQHVYSQQGVPNGPPFHHERHHYFLSRHNTTRQAFRRRRLDDIGKKKQKQKKTFSTCAKGDGVVDWFLGGQRRDRFGAPATTRRLASLRPGVFVNLAEPRRE